MSESSHPEPTAEQARAALASIDDGRARLGSAVRSPRAGERFYAAGIVLIVFAIGIGNAPGRAAAPLALAGILLGSAALGWSLLRFRAANGAWVTGWRPRGARWGAAVGTCAVVVFGVLAAWAASGQRWWLFAAVCAVAFPLSLVYSRSWMRAYLGELGAR